MEYDDNSPNVDCLYPFFTDKSAKAVFARLDYLLRSGVHIQRDHPKPTGLFNFLDKHIISLQQYYQDLFDMILKKEGEGWNSYFYIDFHEGSRGKIPNENQYRSYLRSESILIGLLFFKVYKLDGNIELCRISDFINVLYQEYEELAAKLRRLVLSSNTDAESDMNEAKFSNIINRAFADFELLGWIARDTNDADSFVYQPSFERLRRIYYPQIENIDELLKQN